MIGAFVVGCWELKPPYVGDHSLNIALFGIIVAQHDVCFKDFYLKKLKDLNILMLGKNFAGYGQAELPIPRLKGEKLES